MQSKGQGMYLPCAPCGLLYIVVDVPIAARVYLAHPDRLQPQSGDLSVLHWLQLLAMSSVTMESQAEGLGVLTALCTKDWNTSAVHSRTRSHAVTGVFRRNCGGKEEGGGKR